MVFDGLDGALARRLGVASPFGAQMDSLADMCSFGLAAPVVVYASLAGTVSTPAAAVACALVAGCAAIRLARFNVSPKDGRFFCGVPTTMAAAVLALAVLIGLPVSGTVQVAGRRRCWPSRWSPASRTPSWPGWSSCRRGSGCCR